MFIFLSNCRYQNLSAASRIQPLRQFLNMSSLTRTMKSSLDRAMESSMTRTRERSITRTRESSMPRTMEYSTHNNRYLINITFL